MAVTRMRQSWLGCFVKLYMQSLIQELSNFFFILLVDGFMVRTHSTDQCEPGCIAQSVGLLTRKSGVLGSIPGLATYFRFSFRFFKKASCQLLGKVCA